MGKSLTVRLADTRDEVLKDTKLYGWNYAMDRWGVHDYLAFRKWLEKETGNADYGVNPQAGLSSSGNLGEQIVDAMVGYILRSQAEKQKLMMRLTYLEGNLKTHELANRDKSRILLELCAEGR